MMGTEGNADPRSFWQADLGEASARLEAIVREVEADVIVGYNDFGGYGHPDHIRAALIAKSAFEATAGSSGPAKLYESVLQWSRMEARPEGAGRARHRVRLGARGPMRAAEEKAEREAFGAKMAAAAGPVTTSVDVTGFEERKIAALRAHVTQISATNPFLALGADALRRYQPTEDFTLRVSRIGVRIPETDLFAGLR